MAKFTCPICGTEYEVDDEGELIHEGQRTYEYLEYANLLKDEVCSGCIEQIDEYGAVIFRFEKNSDYDDYDMVKFLGYHAIGKGGEEPPYWFDKSYQSFKQAGTNYHGYDDPQFDLDMITDGWYTGYSDYSTSRKKLLSDFGDWLKENPPSVPLYVLMAKTSNIFSQAFTIYAEKGQLEKAKDFLNASPYTVEALHNALS